MNEELKKCPFCGGEVDFWTKTEAKNYQALIIDCKDCPANMEKWVYKYDKNFAKNFEKKKAEMFEAWNSRSEQIAKVKKFPVECFNEAYAVMSGYCDCGALVFNDERNKYCPHCGAKLDWSE